MGWANGGGPRAGQGRNGGSAPDDPRIGSASGRVAANPRRMRLLVSTARAAIFKKTECRKLGSGQFLEAVVAARKTRIATFIEDDCKLHS